MTTNHKDVILSPADHLDRSIDCAKRAQLAWDVVEQEHRNNVPNSQRCRLNGARAAHYRKLAEVHALLAQGVHSCA